MMKHTEMFFTFLSNYVALPVGFGFILFLFEYIVSNLISIVTLHGYVGSRFSTGKHVKEHIKEDTFRGDRPKYFDKVGK